jgi:hypothetical protein
MWCQSAANSPSQSPALRKFALGRAVERSVGLPGIRAAGAAICALCGPFCGVRRLLIEINILRRIFRIFDDAVSFEVSPGYAALRARRDAEVASSPLSAGASRQPAGGSKLNGRSSRQWRPSGAARAPSQGV